MTVNVEAFTEAKAGSFWFETILMRLNLIPTALASDADATLKCRGSSPVCPFRELTLNNLYVSPAQAWPCTTAGTESSTL